MNITNARSIGLLAVFVSGMVVGACGGSKAPVENPPGGFFRMRFYETLLDPAYGQLTTTVGGQALRATHYDDLEGAIGVVLGFNRVTNFEGWAVSPSDPRLPAIWNFEALTGPCNNTGDLATADVYQNSLIPITCYVWASPAADLGFLGDGTPVYTGGNDKLMPGDILWPEETRTSADGRFTLKYQSDGNLVLYDSGWSWMWQTDTDGTCAGHTIMQTDGNFVVYDCNGNPVWHSWSFGNPGALLVVQSDGNVVVYAENADALWHSGTGGH